MSRLERPSVENAFESPYQLVARAKEHIADFVSCDNRVIRDNQNWSLFQQIDPKTGDKITQAKFATRALKPLAPIINDVAYNLRSALDHAVYASAVAVSGGDPTTKFPFGDTEADFLRDIKKSRLTKSVPATILKMICAFQPYEAGNKTLWALNKLRNRKGHRVLSPMHLSNRNGTIGTWFVEAGNIRTFANRQGGGEEVIGIQTSSNFKGNGQVGLAFAISLYGVRHFENEPVVTTLNTFASEVQHVVEDLEEETSRLLRTES